MENEHPEPPRPPIGPELQSHTTLRTLFVITTVFALAASLWTAPNRFELMSLLVTPCAAAFVIGQLGLSLPSGLVVGLVTFLALYVFESASEIPYDVSVDLVLRYANAVAVPSTMFLGPSWLTASWWGLYLRYAWSNAANWPPQLDGDRTTSGATCEPCFRDRLVAGCASNPLGFAIISLLVSISFALMGVVFMSEPRY